MISVPEQIADRLEPSDDSSGPSYIDYSERRSLPISIPDYQSILQGNDKFVVSFYCSCISIACLTSSLKFLFFMYFYCLPHKFIEVFIFYVFLLLASQVHWSFYFLCVSIGCLTSSMKFLLFMYFYWLPHKLIEVFIVHVFLLLASQVHWSFYCSCISIGCLTSSFHQTFFSVAHKIQINITLHVIFEWNLCKIVLSRRYMCEKKTFKLCWLFVWIYKKSTQCLELFHDSLIT